MNHRFRVYKWKFEREHIDLLYIYSRFTYNDHHITINDNHWMFQSQGIVIKLRRIHEKF